MPNTEARAGLRQLVCGALLSLYLAAPAYAFTPSDSPLLSAAAVPPNVMLLIDDSGSMNNIIWDPDFKPATNYPQIAYCNSNTSCFSGVGLDMTDTNVQLSTLNRGGCSTDTRNGRWYGFYRGFLGLSSVCMKLPDPVGNEATRYTANYLSYLVSRVSGQADFTNKVIPDEVRLSVAQDVSKNLVASNRSLRIGLATFNPPASGNSGPGGYIARAISDLSPVGSVTQNTANTNYNNLITSIESLGAIANTPLAEAYYEITRYMRGMAPYYNSSPSTYTSPIQYRCQKNYGVVITDGLPTFDRTYPTNDPQATAQGGPRLPNWDGKNNDGDNPLGGDGEGDSLFLDDIAKFAFDIDMRSTGNDVTDKSWNSGDFPKQNMNTYTVGFTAANEMLSSAAAYGQGKYYQATDSAGLTAALSSALSEITSKAGSGGGGTSSGPIIDTGSAFYQTGYDPKDWRGTIKSFGFTSSNTVNTSVTLWNTDQTIVPAAPAPVYQSWQTVDNVVVPLVYERFSPAQRVSLSQNVPNGLSGIQLVEWAKGTNITGLKFRAALLGDIINSPLVLISPTEKTAADLSGDMSYTAYLAKKSASMTPGLVVNANDGFVSVINTKDGRRRYAYMPSSVLPSLRYIADPSYINGVSHKFLVDGQIGVFDAKVGATWKTLAIGGTGAGGKTFYGLQLFDGSTNDINAVWEISAPATPTPANAFNDLGYAYARPEVARLPNGRWAAFISNGYGSHSGVAALYVVDVASGALIRKIVADSTETNNGLSSVKLRVNASNTVEAAYAGDLKGRMWKFQFAGEDSNGWGVAFAGKPLFTAPATSLGATQPITVQPLLADNPVGGKMVFFGTGKFNETADKTNKDLQAFYAIWDAEGGSGQIPISSLQAQSVSGVFSGSSGQFVTVSQNDTTYPAKKGWYLPLVYNNALTGERVINQASLVLGRIIFTTASVDTTDPCSSFGTGKLVELDAFTGKMLNYAVLDTNNDGVVDSNDAISAGVVFSGGIPTLNAIVNGALRKVVTDSSGGITTLIEKGGGGSRRIMWRQIQ